MKHRIQTVAIAFLIFLSTLCNAQSKDNIVVTSSRFTGHYAMVEALTQNARLLLSCDTYDRICKMPIAGDTGTWVVTVGPYAGTNILITWSDGSASVYNIQTSKLK